MSQVRETPDIETASDAYARRFSGRAGAYFLGVQSAAVDHVLAGHAPGLVLDVGGGHAQLAPQLRAAGHTVVVLGSAPACHTRLRAPAAGDPFSCVTGDLLRLPFADASFDTVIAVRLISHIEDWPALLAEFCRVARHSVVIDYPSLFSPNALTPLLFRFKKRIEGNTRTYTSFRAGELGQVFARHGFKIAAQRKQFFLPMFLHRALRGHAVLRGLERLCGWLQLTRLFGSPVILRADRASTSTERRP